MERIDGSWIWRIAAALFIGAILTLGVSALPEPPGGEPVPADVGQSSDDSPPPTDAPKDDESDEVEDDMARSVGEPSDDADGDPDGDVDVEVLSEADEAEPLDPDSADIGSAGPATQVDGDPQFTG